MKHINLYIMIGCPGSGKTTYAKALQETLDDCVYISRDEVRYSMVSEQEKYFSKEREVYKEFTRQIKAALKARHSNIIVDATHLNAKSRGKLTGSLIPQILYDITINYLYMDTPLHQCLKNNATRIGHRSYVPEHELESMFYKQSKPVAGIEKFDTLTVIPYTDLEDLI